MMQIDRNALICDLAETYGIYDMYQFSPNLISIYAQGLRENSRIKLKLAGQKYPLETVMQASIVDALHILLWTKTKDAEDGKNRPMSLVSKLLDLEEKTTSEDELVIFDGAEAFEMAKKNILEG